MIYVPSKNLLFVHIPKCGGWYTKTLIQMAFADAVTLCDYLGTTQHAIPNLYWRFGCVRHNRPKAFAFVRNPVAWIESWWKYNTQRGWPTWECDFRNINVPRHHLRHSDFNGFVRKWLTLNNGGVTRMFDSYCQTGFAVDWYHSEDIDELLPQMLGLDCLPQVPDEETNKSTGTIEWDPELKKRFIDSELAGFRRYNYDI